jgi:alkylation response protein AidB-like acyl-CoA dehydrogenase
MIRFLDDDPVDLTAYTPLRQQVREFLAAELAAAGSAGWVGSWENFDRDFTRKLGARGWLGMAIPQRYGGHERSVLERYIVTEELLAAGAPVAAHWIADRQSAPLLLRFGTEDQRQTFLPKIATGEYCFAIGMSEPDSGSDLAGLRTRAVKDGAGWRINGTKVWTTNAHRVEYMIALCRTAPVGEDRHAGLTQFLIDLHAPGVTVNPIHNLAGDHHFNEVVFEDYYAPDERVVGEPGNGWQQVVSELAFERSSPDRFLSTFRLLVELIRVSGPQPDRYSAVMLGTIVARLWAIRQMSIQVAALLDRGGMPNTEASLVKDLGTSLEQEIPEIARLLIAGAIPADNSLFDALLQYDILHTPSFSLRGGTREVIRGIIARGLGLR